MNEASNRQQGCLTLEGGGDVYLPASDADRGRSFEKVTGPAVWGLPETLIRHQLL
jgi:hypothetical protein